MDIIPKSEITSPEYLSSNELLKLLNSDLGLSGYRPENDPLFLETDLKYKTSFTKQGIYNGDNENEMHERLEISCNVPGCYKEFDTVFAYDSHYNSLHRFLCSICKKNLLTAHLLDIHLSETHDSYFKVQSITKAMYSCFLPECPIKSTTPDERRKHCIDEHKFVSNFRFDTTTKWSRSNKPSEMDVDPASLVNNAETSETKVNLIPKDIHFGHGITKTFLQKSNSKKNSITKKEISAGAKDEMNSSKENENLME